MIYSCTPDRNCHTFCLGDKIASHPGVLTQAKQNTQNLEINQILGVVVQEKESNMVFFSRWKFPTLGMTVLSGTSAEPRFRSARSSLGLETSIKNRTLYKILIVPLRLRSTTKAVRYPSHAVPVQASSRHVTSVKSKCFVLRHQLRISL